MKDWDVTKDLVHIYEYGVNLSNFVYCKSLLTTEWGQQKFFRKLGSG